MKRYTSKLTLKQVLDWASAAQQRAITSGATGLEDKISDAILAEYNLHEVNMRCAVRTMAEAEGKTPQAYVRSMLKLMQQDK
jgi:hypothetical protein